MKKLLATLASALLTAALALSFAGCATGTPADVIVVGATSQPHAEILEQIKDGVSQAGYRLVIRVYSDYPQLNPALEEGSLDANYFQHTPYLEDYNAQNGGHLVAVAKIHYEPLGIYGNGAPDYQTKTGRTILIPNDTTNCTRALFLLAAEGFLTLREGATPTDALSVQDIAEKNGNTIREADAAILPSQLKNAGESALAVVNGNYALAGGLSDALAVESAEGDAAQLYANVIAVREENAESEKTKVLIAALKTQKVIDFINRTYGGAVLPVFSV